MVELILMYIGMDSWSRPVYKDPDGNLFKDVDPRKQNRPELCTVSDFDGEPDTPIRYIKKYEDVNIMFLPSRETW